MGWSADHSDHVPGNGLDSVLRTSVAREVETMVNLSLATQEARTGRNLLPSRRWISSVAAAVVLVTLWIFMPTSCEWRHAVPAGRELESSTATNSSNLGVDRELDLSPLAKVAGVVRAQVGVVATVSLSDHSGLVRSVESDREGRYLFSDVKPGQYEVMASHDILGSVAVRIQLSKGTTEVPLAFLPLCSISGTVESTYGVRSVFVNGSSSFEKGGAVFRAARIEEADKETVRLTVSDLWPGDYRVIATAGALSVAEDCLLESNGDTESVALSLETAIPHGHTTGLTGRAFLDDELIVNGEVRLKVSWPARSQSDAQGMTLQSSLKTNQRGEYSIELATLDAGTSLEFFMAGTTRFPTRIERHAAGHVVDAYLLSIESNGSIRLQAANRDRIRDARLYGGRKWRHPSVFTDLDGVARFFDVPQQEVAVSAKLPVVSATGLLTEQLFFTRTNLVENPSWHIEEITSTSTLKVTYEEKPWVGNARLYLSGGLEGNCAFRAGTSTIAWQGTGSLRGYCVVSANLPEGGSLWGKAPISEGQPSLGVELAKPMFGTHKFVDGQGAPVDTLLLLHGRERLQTVSLGGQPQPLSWKQLLGGSLLRPQASELGRFSLGEVLELGVDWSGWWLLAPGVGVLNMDAMPWDSETVTITTENAVVGDLNGPGTPYVEEVGVVVGGKMHWGIAFDRSFVVPVEPGEDPEAVQFTFTGRPKVTLEDVEVGVRKTYRID